MQKTKIIVFSIAFFLSLPFKNGLSQETSPSRIQSSQLKQTTITSYLQENIEQGKNLLYCSAFQIAWDVLSDDVIKEPLQLEDNPMTAQMLNKRLTGKEDISEDCYIAMAGLKRDGIVEKITKALRDKFNTSPGIDLNLDLPEDILSYAFLQKDLKFKNEFESLEKPINFNGTTSVKGFGIESVMHSYPKHAELMKQLNILFYKNKNDFIITLKSTSPRDEIILAKVRPENNLLETINTVFTMIKINAVMIRLSLLI